jgi:tryptophan synthase beta subunit
MTARRTPRFPDARGHFGRHGGRFAPETLMAPLHFAARLREHCGGARIFVKREDLCHTGAQKIDNVLGQALLAARATLKAPLRVDPGHGGGPEGPLH